VLIGINIIPKKATLVKNNADVGLSESKVSAVPICHIKVLDAKKKKEKLLFDSLFFSNTKRPIKIAHNDAKKLNTAYKFICP
jgi:hypothetical protein